MQNHSKPKTRFLMLTALTVSVLTHHSARAADAINQEDPAPPEPVFEQATALSGWYIAGRIGAAFAEDAEFATLGTQVQTAFDPGLALSGAVGYEFKRGAPLSFRGEAEIGYISLDVDSHNVVGTGSFSGANAGGRVNALYGLVNGYVDYEIGSITPYVGAGIGYAQLEADGFNTTPAGVILNDRDNGLAWQIGAGAAYSITDTLKFDLGYRYFGIQDVGLTATDGTTSNVDLKAHQITLGIRMAF